MLNETTKQHAEEFGDPEYYELVEAWLGGVGICDPTVFREESDYDSEEQWVLPKAVEVFLTAEDVTSKTMSRGSISFCVYRDARIVVEQNASPLIVYRKL